MSPDVRDARVRRPRVRGDRQDELLKAALEVLREDGYEAMSMDAVAARARCGKATLYRQWNSKAGLVAAALGTARPDCSTEDEYADTGSLRGDLLAGFRKAPVEAEKDTELFAAVGHALLTDADLAAAVRTAFLEPERARLERTLDRAVERGELTHRPAAADLLMHTMVGAVLSRPLVEGPFADTDYLKRLVDTVVLPALHNS